MRGRQGIGVFPKDGTVTLNGLEPACREDSARLCAAQQVVGINAIADGIEVNLPGSVSQTDGSFGVVAAPQIKRFSFVPDDAVKVTVRHCRIALEGA